MNIEEFRDYCLSFVSVTESFPFDSSTLVFKVEGKMFALVNVDNYSFFNVKCDPDRALELRADHVDITPAYHMNKKHWNSVSVEGGLSDVELKSHIKHSYQQVVKGMPKRLREALMADWDSI